MWSCPRHASATVTIALPYRVVLSFWKNHLSLNLIICVGYKFQWIYLRHCLVTRLAQTNGESATQVLHRLHLHYLFSSYCCVDQCNGGGAQCLTVTAWNGCLATGMSFCNRSSIIAKECCQLHLQLQPLHQSLGWLVDVSSLFYCCFNQPTIWCVFQLHDYRFANCCHLVAWHGLAIGVTLWSIELLFIFITICHHLLHHHDCVKLLNIIHFLFSLLGIGIESTA